MNAATTTITTAAKTSKKRGKTGSTKSAKATAGPVTLGELAERYLKHIQASGKSLGTCFSYSMDLAIAKDALGADTPIATLTAETVKEFFESDATTKTRTGRPKAKPTVDKTRRVLRLALCWAAEKKLIEVAPLPAVEKADAVSPTSTITPTEQA